MNQAKGFQIGLITPYTGSNLGDGAIQDAVIENLSSVLDRASFSFFNLDPARTSRLHGIPAFPITGLIVDYYSNTLKGNEPEEEASTESLLGKLKRKAALRRLFRPAWLVAKGILLAPLKAAKELRHVIKMYRSLAGYDALIVSGGGQIDDFWGGPMGHPYVLWKWAVLAKARGIKFIVLSIGVCALESKLSTFFVSGALSRAAYRSYRDAGSKTLLNGMAFTRLDRVIPDLAFSYPIPQKHGGIAKTSSTLRIGISPIAYLYQDRWPKADARVFGNYVGVLTEFISKRLVEGHEIILFATDAPDREVSDLILRQLEAQKHSRLTVVPVFSVRELLNQMSGFDFVIGSRLHGIILAHLCSIPTIAISYDRKVDQHMLEMEQERFCADIHALQVEILHQKFQDLTADPETIQVNLANRIGCCRKQVMEQYREVAALVRNNSPLLNTLVPCMNGVEK